MTTNTEALERAMAACMRIKQRRDGMMEMSEDDACALHHALLDLQSQAPAPSLLAREEAAHENTIRERDAAETALSDLVALVLGRPPEWSNHYGYADALDECRDKLAAPAPVAPASDEEDLRRLMRDPRYWRDRDPDFIAKVTEGFRRLYGEREGTAPAPVAVPLAHDITPAMLDAGRANPDGTDNGLSDAQLRHIFTGMARAAAPPAPSVEGEQARPEAVPLGAIHNAVALAQRIENEFGRNMGWHEIVDWDQLKTCLATLVAWADAQPTPSVDVAAIRREAREEGERIGRRAGLEELAVEYERRAVQPSGPEYGMASEDGRADKRRIAVWYADRAAEIRALIDQPAPPTSGGA